MEELALFYVSNLFLFLLVNPVNTGSCMQSFYHVYTSGNKSHHVYTATFEWVQTIAELWSG